MFPSSWTAKIWADDQTTRSTRSAGPHILIVEDEPSIADTIQFPLESDRCITERCSTGAEALDWLAKERFDLVVLDVGLPDMTGFEVCRRIRTTSTIPILFLTARSQSMCSAKRSAISANSCLSPDTSFACCKFWRARRDASIHGRSSLEAAWEEPEASMERTVDAHIKTLRSKLRQVRPNIDAIQTHRGFGYSLALRNCCRRSYRPSSERARFLSNIRTESARLQRLIDELLALSVVENRKTLDAPQRIDLCRMVERVVNQTGERASSVKINFAARRQAFVIGDEYLLENAVTNLLQNAVEFSPPDGVITVSIEQAGKTVLVRILEYALANLRALSLVIPAVHRQEEFGPWPLFRARGCSSSSRYGNARESAR